MMNTKNKKKNFKRTTKSNKEINNITYTNKNIGFSIAIPDTWMEVKKSSYEDLGINNNTLFIFVTNKFTSLTAIFSGFGKIRSFNKFFEKFNLDGKYKVLYQDETEINKLKVKQLVIETDTNKIMHNFCLINGMIINFTINIDPKNKIFDKKSIINDSNFKQMNEILNTIKVFEPINPPVYVDDTKTINSEVVETIDRVEINTEKTLAQILVETECKYKNILVPDLYLKYTCSKDNSNVSLNIINNEIYIKKLNGSFKVIKINEDVANEIERIIHINMPYLCKLSINEKTNSKSILLVKVESKYAYIDLNDAKINVSILEDILIDILKEIKNNNDIALDIEELFLESKQLEPDEGFNKKLDEVAKNEEIKHETDSEVSMFLEQVKEEDAPIEKQEQKEETEELEPDEEFNKKLDEIAEVKEIKHDVDEDLEKVLDNNANEVAVIPFITTLPKTEEIKEIDIPNVTKEVKEENTPIEKQEQKEETEELEHDEDFNKKLDEVAKDEEIKHDLDEDFEKVLDNHTNEAAVIPFITTLPETEEIKEMDIPNVTKEVKEEMNVKAAVSTYNLDDFQEYFHNVDGHASFKFMFPVNTGEKVIRDFNVFDIVNYDQLIYRIFLFKCETEEKYETKLKTWMDKNIISSKTTLQSSYTTTSDNGLEIRTYILENGKFYKVVYIYGYLIAISGYNDEDTLTYANIALDNVEIGEDSRAFVEAHDRKMRSISILQAQQIPYIDELPVIKSSYEVTGKTIDDIAKRAIVLCICCNFASDIVSNKKKRYIKESKKFFSKLLDNFNVKDVMTKDEKLLFDKMNKDLAIQISWQFESYVILLWTLGLIDEVTFPDTLVEPDSVTAIVSACDTYREFLEKCQLRSVDEVLDLADLTYRYNWYCVESKINEDEPVMNPEIVMERHRTLNWLLSDEKWDKVEINT